MGRPCEKCGRPLIFVASEETGELIPLDARAPTFRVEPRPDGKRVAVRAEGVFVSHFSTCTDPDLFSKAKISP